MVLAALVTVILAWPVAGSAADEARTTNIAPNPGAEKGSAGKLPEDWSHYGKTPAEAGITEKVHHAGKRSAFLKVTGFGKDGLADTGLAVGRTDGFKGPKAISVKPNTKYYFTFSLKGKGFTDKIDVRPWSFKSDGSGLDRSIPGIRVVPTSDWMHYFGSFTTGAQTGRLVLMFHVHGKRDRDVKPGAVFYVDDVYLGATEAAAKAYVAYSRESQAAPDVGLDPDYLDKKIKHISDKELFASMDLTRPELAKVRKAAEAADYRGAYRAWAVYWKQTHQAKPPSPQKSPSKRLLDRAAKIMRHEIRAWGDVTIKHGPVVNFDADYGVGGKYGFHKWFWSNPLLRAYRTTSDEKYLSCFDELFNQWYQQRDRISSPAPPQSVIWYELGLAHRGNTFIEFYRRPFSKRTLLTHERMLKTLLGSARWLFKREDTGYRKGNWQVTGSFGLANIGLAVPEFTEAQAWVRTGARRIVEHAERDFFKDGGHSERCPSSYMFGVYYKLMRSARMLEGKPAYARMVRSIDARLQQGAKFWMYLTTPEGHLSGINDGQRAVFGPGTLTEAGKLFKRKDFLFVAKNLLGGKVDGRVRSPKHTSINFADSGFAVMRSDWTPRARYMLLNYGPDRVWHTHRDILDFEISAFGRALAIDAGLGLTYDDPLNNPWYNASRAHNMLVVDDGEIDRAVAQGRDVVWDSRAGLDFFAATTHGWEKDATIVRPGDYEVPMFKGKGVIWRRHVAFVKPDYWVMYDVAWTAKEGHTLSWYLHSPTDLVAKNGGYASAKAPGLFARPVGGTFTTRRGKGRASVRGLGFKKPYRNIDWVAFDAPSKKAGRVTFPMLLYPFEKTFPNVNLRVVSESEKGAHFVVQSEKSTDHIVFSLGKKGFRDKDIQTDGHCAVVRCRKGKPVSWSVAGGRKLIYRGVRLQGGKTKVRPEGPLPGPTVSPGRTGYKPMPKGANYVRVWDLGKKYTYKHYRPTKQWKDRANWIQVPYGAAAGYKFRGDCMLEGPNFWMSLHASGHDACFLYNKIDAEGTPSRHNEMYRSYDQPGGLRTYCGSYEYNKIIKNERGDIIVESRTRTRRRKGVDVYLINRYRVQAGKPWLEVQPMNKMVSEQGMHGESRIHISPESLPGGQDFLADAWKYSPDKSVYHPHTSRMLLDLIMDDDCIWAMMWKTTGKMPTKDKRPYYLHRARSNNCRGGYPAGWQRIGEGKSPLIFTSPFVKYRNETMVIGVLRIGHWHYQKIGKAVQADKDYKGRFKYAYLRKVKSSPFSTGKRWWPMYPGKWRMIGCVDGKYYTQKITVTKNNVGKSEFTFRSPLTGTLEYIVFYLYDRTDQTPKDVFTIMDIYRRSIGNDKAKKMGKRAH